MRPSSSKFTTPLVALALSVGFMLSGTTQAQQSFDDHELTDRFYITIGGYNQQDIRTTFRLDAKTPNGIGLGGVIGLESLFDVESEITTGRLDGWYRFGKKNRVNWSYWKSDRTGVRTYQGDPISIGDIQILPDDVINTEDNSTRFALSWSYSFLNTSKYELWIGAGLNTNKVDLKIDTNIGTGFSEQVEAKGTIPIPTANLGGRWNFSKRTRALLFTEIFGIKVGDFEGRLNNTRFLVEYSITKNFGIGGGFERNQFEIDAENEDFLGSLDSSYSGLTLYLKGQI